MANNHGCICQFVSSHSPRECCVPCDFYSSCEFVMAGCLALWQGGPAAPQRTCAICLLRWILSNQQWPLSTSSTKSCWDLNYTVETFVLLAGGWAGSSMTNRRYQAPGQTALYQCFLKVLLVYNLLMNDTIYRIRKKTQVHPIILLLATPHSPGHQFIVTKDTNIFPLFWRCCH